MRNTIKTSRTIRGVVLLCALVLFCWAGQAFGEAQEITVLFFWGDGCPHCAEEKVFLDDLKKGYPNLVIEDLEVWKNRENARAFKRAMERLGAGQVVVPVTVIANRIFYGFDEQQAGAIEAAVRDMSKASPVEEPSKTVLPLIGEIDPADFSLPVLTLIIAGLDSFNPCALYVLMFLLSMLIYARSRARMLIVGGTYLFFSGSVYFLFMAAWLNLFMLMGRVHVVTTVAGLVALVIGIINVKDFFAFKRGVSLTLADEHSDKLIGKMRGLLKANSLPAMLLGTSVLAILANAYELLCTAGFPMVYTRVLTLRGLGTGTYYLYLVFYNVIYVVPLAIVVMIFTLSLGSRKLTEFQGRSLKLVSGFMMVCLSFVLLAGREWLGNPLVAVAMLGVALATSAVVILIYRGRMKKEGTS
jgi:thiol-disulfide isomerase/thioredoxin